MAPPPIASARLSQRDGSWIVNGSKIFITNAGTDITACVTITARTGLDISPVYSFAIAASRPNGRP